MVTLRFSGAWASAPAASASPRMAAARTCISRFIVSSSWFSEPDADFRGKRGVVAHLLGLDGEVRADEVQVDAAEDSPAARVLRRHRPALGARLHAHRARAEIRR